MSGEFTINPQELSQAMMAMQQQPSMRVPSFQGSAPQTPISQAQSYGNEGPSLFKCIAVPAIAGGGATALGAYFFTDPKFLDASNKVKDEFIHLFQDTASIQKDALGKAEGVFTQNVKTILNLSNTMDITAESVSGVIRDLRDGRYATNGLSNTARELVSDSTNLSKYFNKLTTFENNTSLPDQIAQINKLRTVLGINTLAETTTTPELTNEINNMKLIIANNDKFKELYRNYIARQLEIAQERAKNAAKRFFEAHDIATQTAKLTKLNAKKAFYESIKDGTTAEQLAERLHELNPNFANMDKEKAKKVAQAILGKKEAILNGTNKKQGINALIQETENTIKTLKDNAQTAAKEGLKDGKPTANAAQCVKTAFSKIKWQQVGKIAGIAAAIAAIAGVTYYLLKPKQQPPSPFVQAHQA